MARAYATINVDVYLDEFETNDLIDEIEDRGYRVIENDDYAPEDLTSDEIAAIVAVFQYYKPGTIGNSIYEKLRKR